MDKFGTVYTHTFMMMTLAILYASQTGSVFKGIVAAIITSIMAIFVAFVITITTKKRRCNIHDRLYINCNENCTNKCPFYRR